LEEYASRRQRKRKQLLDFFVELSVTQYSPFNVSVGIDVNTDILIFLPGDPIKKRILRVRELIGGKDVVYQVNTNCGKAAIKFYPTYSPCLIIVYFIM